MEILSGFVAFLSAAFDFLGKVLLVPELHAMLLSVCVGMALSYLFAQTLPAWTAVKTAVRFQRVIVFFAVMGTALSSVYTPRMAAWAFTVAIFTPLFYEWLGTIIFHKWPWLRPRSMLSAEEMLARANKKDQP